MSSAYSVIKTGLQAQDAQLAIIAQNMANINTFSFKQDRGVFQDLFYQIEQPPGGLANDNNPVPLGIQRGTGVRLVGTQKIFTQGNPVTTDRPLDLAIEGLGFFQVQMDNGEVGYTRDGRLRVNKDSQLETMNGLLVLPEIVVPEQAMVSIDQAGVVTATLPGASTATEIGQLQLVNFVNPAGLLVLGGNLYKETEASGPPIIGNPGEDGLGKIMSGTIEGSNVKAVEQMVDLMTAQRTYEMGTKVLSAVDNTQQYLAQSVR